MVRDAVCTGRVSKSNSLHCREFAGNFAIHLQIQSPLGIRNG
jgi:hypothetical protein